MGHIYPTGEIGVEHTSHVVTLPDGKRQYVRGYPIYYGRRGHGQGWMGPFTNLPDLARCLGESPEAVKCLIDSGDGPLGPGTASKYQLVNGKPAHVGEEYRPALYNVIRGRMGELPPVPRTFPKAPKPEASAGAAEEGPAAGSDPES